MLKNKYIIALIALLLVVAIWYYTRKKNMIPFFENTTPFKYFKFEEFDATVKSPEDNGKDIYVNSEGQQKLVGSGKSTIKRLLVKMLDDARHIIQKEWNDVKPASEKIVLEIESGVRTQHFNDSLKNSVKNSSHITGYATDLRMGKYTTEQQTVILEALKRVGFNRFGMGKTTVHVDVDPTKSKNKVWYYSGATILINPLKLA